ncbi:unnamed protein product, partial [Tenebrio molitor]
MPLDSVIVARIVALIQDGRGQRETARIVGKSLCAVQNVYQRYEETGLITRRPGSGRKRVTTRRDDRFLVSTSLRNRTASAVLLRNQLQEVRDVNVNESRFCLNGSDGRRRVWRRPGERYAPVCIDERLPFGGGSVMVWAGISAEARTNLVFIQNGSLTAHRYITEVLEDHVMPFMITMGEHGILMHDNARPHAARIVRGYLDEVGIRRFDW